MRTARDIVEDLARGGYDDPDLPESLRELAEEAQGVLDAGPESMLFDVSVEVAGDRAIVKATSGFDTGISLRLDKQQVWALAKSLNAKYWEMP
jgi:hypothetical protein